MIITNTNLKYSLSWSHVGDLVMRFIFFTSLKYFSFLQGNINQLVVKLASYVATLDRTQGVMEEFVNPKYADATKTTFKKPTRLECMMQDYAKVLPSDSSKIGFTTSASWIGYSPAKNSISEGVAKLKVRTSVDFLNKKEITDNYFFALLALCVFYLSLGLITYFTMCDRRLA